MKTEKKSLETISFEKLTSFQLSKIKGGVRPRDDDDTGGDDDNGQGGGAGVDD